MPEQVTKTDFNNLESRLDKRFDDLMALVSQFADDVQSKFSDYDKESRELNKNYNRLINTIDGFISRIDSHETELAARDQKIERLERWIQEIAAKTKVSLT